MKEYKIIQNQSSFAGPQGWHGIYLDTVMSALETNSYGQGEHKAIQTR